MPTAVDPARRSMLRKVLPASGAISAQTSQAITSVVLQVLVARSLGGAGLSTYALLYGGIVLATAVVTGLVGDTLTVVDRSLPRVRSGLLCWALGSASVLAVAGGLVGGAVLGGAGSSGAGSGDGGFDVRSGIVFGAAVAAFVLEDCLRRLLMVCERFWRLVAVDLSALIAALVTVGVLRATSDGPGLEGFLLAVGVGQVVGGLVALLLLPASERRPAPWRGADLRVVLGFGTWRAAQQTLRPGMLTAGRALVIGVLGAALYGEVEAARLLVTPLTLVIGGVGSLLLVRYARASLEPAPADAAADATSVDLAGGRRTAVRRADRAALALLGASAALGAVATALTPLLGGLITSGRFEVDRLAVIGWVVYAASTAVVLPYGTLAAVLRRQRATFLIRLGDSVASVGLLALLLHTGASAGAAPWALSVGSLVSAVVIRAWVLSSPRPTRRARLPAAPTEQEPPADAAAAPPTTPR